jgi:radical SAM enzyme (TIGR01210 family)
MANPRLGSTLHEHWGTEWIIAQRPPRTVQDPFKPHGFFLEEERSTSGRVVESGTIFLTNKECPWHCLMCDLWKTTLTYAVPAGAVPRQIDYALAQFGSRPEQFKLYNGGSFFDPTAIPPVDYPEICRKIAFAQHIIVESHPRLIGKKTLEFRDLLDGSLEVAMGLETVHPEILPRLNKNFTLAHFKSAAQSLRSESIGVRAFVLVKTPFMNEAEGLDWAIRSAEFAFECGATVTALIPTRGGNGAMERLQESGQFSPPRLSTLEKALEAALALGKGRVFADTWNLELFSSCSLCLDARRRRLHTINLTQQVIPPVLCAACGST